MSMYMKQNGLYPDTNFPKYLPLYSLSDFLFIMREFPHICGSCEGAELDVTCP